MIKYSIAKPEESDKVGKLFFKIFKPKYKEYLNYDLKEKTCKAISELYIKAGETIIAKNKNKIIGFASVAIPLFSLWKQGLSNFLPGRFMFIAPLKLRYLFKPFCLIVGVGFSYRGRGIGDDLIKELEKTVKKRGASEIYAQIFCSNKPIKKLFEKNNWEIISRCSCSSRKVLILRKEI